MLDTNQIDIENNFQFRTNSSNSVVDCELTNVTITEIYHYGSNEWFELHNSGNETCDLGEWIIGDNDGSNFQISNDTNITSDGYMLFSRSNNDFNFDVSCSNTMLIATRDVSFSNATDITSLSCYGEYDDNYYTTSGDGSWENCNDVWDWNEPDEMTPNATNLCAGNPIILYALESDGTLTQNPISINNGSSTLFWNTSNLQDGLEYQLYSNWNSETSYDSQTSIFIADGSDIEFNLDSNPYWTCEIGINAYILNQSSGQTVERYTNDLDVNCDVETSLILTHVSDGSEVISDGFNFSGNNWGGDIKWTISSTEMNIQNDYKLQVIINQDDEVTYFSQSDSCDSWLTSTSCFIEENFVVYNETCDISILGSFYTISPYGWTEIGSKEINGVGLCDGVSDEIEPAISLYMKNTLNGETWTEVTDDNYELDENTTTQEYYWQFSESAIGSDVRFLFYYEYENVMDEQYNYDGLPIFWNASINDCNPNIYAYIYLSSPNGASQNIDYWSRTMSISCEDSEDIALHIHNESNSDNDLDNGTTNMITNLSNLNIGEEYLFEWYSYESSSYTASNDGAVYGEYYDTYTFTPTSEFELINWAFETPGHLCSITIYSNLYVMSNFSQEWWPVEQIATNDWQEVDYASLGTSGICDGSDIAEFSPVNLYYNYENTWIEVNESTNLSSGIHDMKWQISGLSEDISLSLNTNVEYYLNSTYHSSSYIGNGNFESIWELTVSDWSCNINYEFDLYFYTMNGNGYNIDQEVDNSFIDGPCNSPVDVSSSNGNEPSMSVSVVEGNTVTEIDSGNQLNEGVNTLRWNIQDPVEDYEHYIHMYLQYNGARQEILSHSFIADSGDMYGDWTIDIQEDACDLYLFSSLYVKEYNTWDQIDSQGINIGYSGNNSDCNYSTHQFTISALDNETWIQNPDSLNIGMNQLKFDIESLDLFDNMTYYINTNLNGIGSNSFSFSTYFDLGTGSSVSQSNNYYYTGDDIYFNFTVEEWTCSAQASSQIYYLTPYGGWENIRSMPSVNFDVDGCSAPAELSLSRFIEGEWEEDLEGHNTFELEVGVNEMYWNMSNLNMEEKYELYFYVYENNKYTYQSAGATFYPEDSSISWYFPLDIEQSSCNLHGYGTLRIYSDGHFRDIDSITFYPEEPCIPEFDITFLDDSSSWLDTSNNSLSLGTNQMLFDLSNLGHGDYEIDYYWNSENTANGWFYDNYFTVDENNNGLYWNMTLEETDCNIYIDINVYDRSYQRNDYIGGYNNVELIGPCMLPFSLEVANADGTFDDANDDSLVSGINNMVWNITYLEIGSDYRLNWHWYSATDSMQTDYDFTYNGTDIFWDLNLSIWDCYVNINAYLYNDSNGGNNEFTQYLTYNPEGCKEGGVINLQANRSYGWDDTDDNTNANDGINELRWNVNNLEINYSYTLEVLAYNNGYLMDYTTTTWYSSSDNEIIEFTIDIEEQTTCNVRFSARLFVDSGIKLIQVDNRDFYIYPDCDNSEEFWTIPVLVLQDDGTWSETPFSENGNITVRLDLSNLQNETMYYINGYVSNDYTSESFNWNDFYPSDEPNYIDLEITSDQWTCEISVYVHLHMYTITGNEHVSIPQYYIDTPCIDIGEIELDYNGQQSSSNNINLQNGTNNMTWDLTELINNQSYTLEWKTQYNNDIVDYQYETWFTGNDTNATFEWILELDTEITCNVNIDYRIFIDISSDSSLDWKEMINMNYYDSISCNEYVYPDNYYLNLHAEINGTMVEDPETLPSGEVNFELHFENMSVGADYRMYFYYSNTGFNSNSQYIYFTYDGSPMEMTIDIAPWACDVYFNWDMYLLDFRYDSGNSYNEWYLGNDNFYIDGPCETLNYDSSDYPNFTVTDDAGNDIDDDTDFSTGNNTIILGADNLQNDFPYYMELQVRYDGYLNIFNTHRFIGNNTTAEEFVVTLDIPGHVCNVEVRSYFYVITSSGSNQMNSTNHYADGPCDGSDGDSRINTPLHAYINGTWVEVDDDTFFPTGDTDLSWNLSALDPDTYYYMNFNAANSGWSGYFYGDDIPDYLSDWTMTLSEFKCDMYIYNSIYAISDYTGWNDFGSDYLYPNNDCLDGGDITLEAQDDEGNWSSLTSYGFDLLPGTTNFSWSLDNLLEGYDYEFYWYQQGSDYVSEYQYFTADSNGSESLDFSITIDQYECNVYFYAYLRPMSEYTDMYEETESFSFWPNTPCYPPFNVAAEDAAGDLTLDALDPDFVLSPGDNHLFFDFNHMDNGTTYYLDWYWSSQNSWNGWYQNYIYVDTSDNISDGLHFNMTLDQMECYAYVYVNVYNYSNGNSNHMGAYDINFEGPCMVPFDLDVNGVEFDNQDGNPDLSVGDNDMTWTFDNLDTGINYRLYYNWYNGSNSYSEDYYFTYNESNDYSWNLPIGDWDCNPYAYATLYYADNGSHIFGNEWFYFNVPECYSVWIDHTDSDGNSMNGDDLSNGTNDMSWNIYDLPEGYEFALEMRTYMNGYMQEYSYELFNDSGNVSIDFSIDVDTYSVCDVRVETTLYYLDSDGNWDHVTNSQRYFYQSCDSYESMYPWTVLVDTDADGNYSEVSQYDNIGGNGTIPMMLDLSNLAEDEIYRVEYSWNTASDSEYFNWEDVTLTNNQFYFDVPVTNWDCEVSLYVYILYETLQGYYNHMISTNQYFNTDCLEPGNVSLNMDNMGEVWDDWSNLNNGTNDMSWEMTDLIVGETYTIDWFVKYNYDIVSYEYLTWTAGDSDESIQWSFDMDNSTTCNVEIMYRMFVDSGDSNWIEMDNEYFYWYPSCDQWVYPRDHYVNLNVEINGTMVEDPETLPSGEVNFELHFENMSVGADYRMYFYYSNTGFNSNSQYIYFTYDGSPMEMTIDIAPWACDVYFNWDMYLLDFRYDSGNSYNEWYLGNDNFYIDGPCETLNYDSSDYPNFTVTDDAGNDIDDDTDFSTGNNTIILGADNLQNDFPYYMELQVRYDGYLNIFNTHRFIGNNTTAEEFVVTLDIPGHVCNVEVRSYFYVITSSGSNQMNSTNHYADGPCDGSDGDSRINTPLHAYINGTWVEVDDDTFFPTGDTDLSWNLSALDPDTYYYMNFNAANSGWSGYFYGDDIPDYLSDWTMTLSEFKCDMYIYNSIYAISDYTGWNDFGSDYLYPNNDCLDGGDITLEAQDDEGNWSSLTSYGFDLLPGTTNFSWSLDNLLEGYDYEFYWYQQGSDYVSEYQYFTADSNGSESLDFSITIDQYECNVYFYAYLRPMSEYTDMYEETESFSFWPNTPCYPPFNVAAEDAAGDLTLDALDPDFVLSPGDNHLFFDFNHMDNGTTYYLDWYWSSQNSWNGWYQNYIYVDTSDNISDGLHFNMTLDQMECYAYVYVNVYNYSNGNSNHMGAYDINFEGPCMVPFDLDGISENNIIDIGENNYTWNLDNLDTGSNYSLEYYYSMNSGWYGFYNHDFTFNGTEEFIDFSMNVTEWDCNVNINANIYNTTDGNMNYIYGESWNLYNPNCYQVDYYALDSDGDWIQYNNIDAGTTELFWEINYMNENVPTGYEFKLQYEVVTDYDWSNSIQYSINWTQDDNTIQQLPWSISINEFVCNVYVTSNLYVNTSNGWSSVRGSGFDLYAPCEPMPSGWYNFSMNDNGTWDQLYDGWNHMIQEEGVYEMRWNVMDLDIGVTYEMSWVAYAFGHELSSYSLQWNATDSNGTIDFNITIPHWYCGMEFESKLSFDNDGTMFDIASNYYYEEGPCNSSIEEFTDAVNVDLDLILINDNIYSQNYELMIPFGYTLNDEIKLYLDAVFGNMDGILNASEATMAENSFNSQTNGTEETTPEFALNGVNLTSFTFNPAILSNLTGTPTLTGSWILEYFHIYGVEVTLTIELESEEEIEWYFNILENLDLMVESVKVTDSENVSMMLSNSFNLTSGNYSLNITWLLANIPDPNLELEQLDLVSEEFDELTNIMDESFNVTIHTFQINLTNLSHQDYLITYNVHVDEYYDDNVSYDINQEVNNDIRNFTLLSNIHTCSALISIEVYDRNNEQVLSENYTLEGTCQPYDYDMDGISNEDDAFPFDASEWLDTDGDGYGDNSDAFPNDSNESLDTDGDGIGNNADDDDDGDGIDDESDNDNDDDGVSDDYDVFPYDPTEWSDDDGDGVGDNSDVFPYDLTEWSDYDGDGIGDNSDDDSDGDGVPNDVDDLPFNSEESSDTDGDGVGNNNDAFPNDPDEQLDTDGDGVGDNADGDDDGDGVGDNSDAFPLDSTETTDTDGDGFGDNVDQFPTDSNENTDSDGDNVGNNADAFPSNQNEWADSDGDGVGDNSDVFPSNAAETTDTDSDGFGDNSDEFPNNANEWIDTDDDGVGDNADLFPSNINEWADSDSDGTGDNSDAFPDDDSETEDTDGDGIGDNAQAAAEEADKDGFLPGFSSIMGAVSMLGAAILVAGRRKD
jgi:hypothetical protein